MGKVDGPEIEQPEDLQFGPLVRREPFCKGQFKIREQVSIDKI